MPQIIEVEGELVRVINREIVHTASLADALPLIERRPAFSMFLPKSAIFYSERPVEGSNAREVGFLCEIPPSVRYITKGNRRYRLSMPWTYFWFTFHNNYEHDLNSLNGRLWSMADHRVFHARDKVTGMESRLFTAFLPNVYEDGRICFGSTGADGNALLTTRVDTLVNDWYNTDFNNDVHGSRNHPLPFDETLPYGWRTWVQATRDQGAAAYLQFPEWNDTTSATFYTVEQVIGNGRRSDPINISGEIPPLQIPSTFGRSIEWLSELPDNRSRMRLSAAMQTLATEQPDLFTLTEVEAAQINTPILDDGGEPIP